MGQSRSSRRAFVNTEGRVLERIPRMERVEVNEEGGGKPVGWMEPTGSFLTGGYTPTASRFQINFIMNVSPTLEIQPQPNTVPRYSINSLKRITVAPRYELT